MPGVLVYFLFVLNHFPHYFLKQGFSVTQKLATLG